MSSRVGSAPRRFAAALLGLMGLGFGLASCGGTGDTDCSASSCRAVPDPCAAVSCSDHGSCTAPGGVASCACEAGYVGADCAACAPGYFPDGEACVDAIRFALPMANPDGTMIQTPVVGFDNDPAPGASSVDCRSYSGEAFPHCYDGHDGSDFMLKGGFTTMDAGSTAVLAAAAGEVIEAHDGEFDRCQATAQGIVCPGQNGVTPPNYVKLRHADGQETSYFHLKKGSVRVSVGDSVPCGAELGLVGSSGYSSAPHVHLTLLDAQGTALDPFAGPGSHPESYWVEQDGPNGLPGAACQ